MPDCAYLILRIKPPALAALPIIISIWWQPERGERHLDGVVQSILDRAPARKRLSRSSSSGGSGKDFERDDSPADAAARQQSQLKV